ncbi:MAG: hypothetical protein M0Z36_08115 [Thermaerobacter sp.]|nr:hypothetical protein [Thermaerobacter sp.]
MHLVAAETVIAVTALMMATGWPPGLRPPWAGRGRWWLGGTLALWILGWWSAGVGPGGRERVDLGLLVLVAAAAATSAQRPWLFVTWLPLAAAGLTLRVLVPFGAPLNWPTGIIGPEGAVLGILAGLAVGEPVLGASAAVGGAALSALGHGAPSAWGAASWYLATVAGAVAFLTGALVGRQRSRGGWRAKRLVD